MTRGCGGAGVGVFSVFSAVQGTFEGRTLPERLLVIPQLEVIHFVIEVNEKYGENSYCPLDSGNVRIYDEIFDIEDSLIELEIINGEATYTTFACTPSLSRIRSTSFWLILLSSANKIAQDSLLFGVSIRSIKKTSLICK